MLRFPFYPASPGSAALDLVPAEQGGIIKMGMKKAATPSNLSVRPLKSGIKFY